MYKLKKNKLINKFQRVENLIEVEKSTDGSNIKSVISTQRELTEDEQSFFRIISKNFSFCEFKSEYEIKSSPFPVSKKDLLLGLKIAKSIKQKIHEKSLSDNIEKVAMTASLDDNKNFVLVTDLFFVYKNNDSFETFSKELLRLIFPILKSAKGKTQCLVENFTKSKTVHMTFIAEYETEKVHSRIEETDSVTTSKTINQLEAIKERSV